jgi:HK97 family phage major capsid protein
VLTAAVVGSPPTDGYQLVPEVFSREMIRNLVEISPMRRVARVQQVAGGPVLIPKRTANLTAAWVAETVLHDVSEPSYDQQSVGIFEARVTVEVTNQLLEDSAFDLSAELARDFAEEFGRLEGAAFVSGNGTTEPEGFLTSSLFEESGTAITTDSIIDLLYSVPERFASRGTWLMHRAIIGQVRKLRSAVDGPFVWADTVQPGQPPTLLGRPVLEMPGLASAAASPDAVVAAFGDWSAAYRIFDRIGLEILRDPYTKARYSIVCFHARKRVGGALVRGDAVKGLTA